MVVQHDVEPPPAEEKTEKKHKLKQRFQVIRKLGQGTYGKVQLAINRATNQEVAIKTIKKSKIETEQDSLRIRREIQIMSSIQHPYIIHIYEVFENKDKIVLVMQYASGGELYDYVSERKELSSEEARRIFRQVASAVYYCHKNKICHRDLKLENILLDEKGNAKIADFGLSNVYDERHFLSTFCGSPLYASPEIVKGTPYYGPEVDCWSLGVLLYTLVYGAMPFDGSNFKRLVRQISEADYYEPKRKSDASALIRRLLTVDPAKRATVIDICQDRWVNQGFDHSLLQLAEDMSNLTPVRLDLLLALAPASPTPEEAFDKAANPPDGAEKSESFDFQPAEQDKAINDASDSADFIPAALAAELESQNIKRQCSNDGSLMKMSSVSHKNKKVRTSNSSRRSSVGLLGGPFVHDQEFDDDDDKPQKPSENEARDEVEQEIDAPARQEDGEVTKFREDDAETPGTAEKPMEQGEAVAESEEAQKPEESRPPAKPEAAEKTAAQAEKSKEPTPPEANKEGATVATETAAGEEKSAAPMLARRGSGVRCPGKIVIPKCLNSQASQATSSASPKFKDTKKPPLPQTPKTATVEPPILQVQEGAAAKSLSAPAESAAPERVEPKKVIPVPKRAKSKSPLSASPREREEAVFPASPVQPPSDKSPSVERRRDATSKGILRSTSKPLRELSVEESGKEPEVENVLQSTAEITLSNRKKAEEEQQSSTLWDNAVPGTPEEEIPEPEAPPRRPSPEGSADEHSRVATDSPVRSYKKFTFGKDGTCITESGRVYAQPKSDGSWTTVEKKTKITRRPSNATSVDEEVVRSPGPPPKDELTVPRSASGSSSESNDIFNDMFPDWRTSSPFGNLMRMKSSIKKLNKGSLFRGADPFTSVDTFRRERTPERRAREWGRRGGGQVSTSTDRDSSDEDDFDLHFDSSHPQALFQFMRNMSRDFRNHWKSFLPSTSPFSRSTKEPPSQSSRPQRETLLRFVVDKPSKTTGSEPGTPHTRAMGGGDPFSKRSSGVWDPIDRASLFGTLRRNRLQDLPGRHHADRGTSLDRGAGNTDFWGVHQDPEGTRHRVEKWLHLSNDAADPHETRGDEGPQRSQQKYNRSQSDKFNLGENSRPVYQSEISVQSNRTAPPGAPCSRSLSVNERGGGRRPLVRMQVSINNRGNSNPNAHIVITTPPSAARTECGLWPQEDSARRDDGDSPGTNDSSLLEALQTRGLRSLLSQRSGSLAREVSPRRGSGGEPPDRPPPQSERGKPAAGSSLAPPAAATACCMDDTNAPKEAVAPSLLNYVTMMPPPQRPKTIPISEERRTSDGSGHSPGEESVQERIHRKSFYQRFNDDPRAAARRRSALWDTEYSGLWSQEQRDRDDAALLRKSRSLWDNHVREPRSRSVARTVGPTLSVAPQPTSRHGQLWDLSFDASSGIPGSGGSNHRCNRTESKDYDSLESDGPPS